MIEILDLLFSGTKTLRIVRTLKNWTFGIDKRFGKLERRVGRMELAMIQKGYPIEPETDDEQNDEETQKD